MKRLDSRWLFEYRDDDEGAKKYEERLTNSSELFDSLRAFIKSFQRDSRVREKKIGDPNWPQLLLRENGYQQALDDLLQILPKEEETNE